MKSLKSGGISTYVFRRRFIIGLVILLLGAKVSAQSRLSCLLFGIELNRADHVWLEPHSERYLIAGIMKASDGERYLAVQDYLGDHALLAASVLVRIMDEGAVDPRITSYEFLGEVHLVNSRDERGIGLVKEVMDTSGMGHALRLDKDPTAAMLELGGFENLLRPFAPQLFHSEFRATGWSRLREHLTDNPGSVRHEFARELNALIDSIRVHGFMELETDGKLMSVLTKARWTLEFMARQGHFVSSADRELARDVERRRFLLDATAPARFLSVLQRLQMLRKSLADHVSVIRIP